MHGCAPRLEIPRDIDNATLKYSGREITLTNLRTILRRDPQITKADLLQYYADTAEFLLPHIREHSMSIGRRANHPVILDLPSLLWMVNLGTIELRPWFSRSRDFYRPAYLHFGVSASEDVLHVHEFLSRLHISCYAKTSGTDGFHVFVPIAPGERDCEVRAFVKCLALEMEARHPRVLVNHLLRKPPVSAYSVLCDSVGEPLECVSTPVSWQEIENGIQASDLTLRSVPERLARLGDPWKPLLDDRPFSLSMFLSQGEIQVASAA